MARLSEIIGPKDYDGIFVESPSVGDYVLLLSSPFSDTYRRMKAVCGAGTCTVQLKINGTLVGSALSVSSTPATLVLTQSVVENDKVEVSISAVSSVTNLEVFLSR